MIPLRIEVTNFGALSHAEIDLSDITLAAVCGPNGAGKSTLFTIAPVFALFGVTKGGRCGPDDLVRTGTQEAAVTLEFEHRGEIYRVTRTRSTKGRGKSTLELQRMAGSSWVSESGSTIRETEERIRFLLNLDAETFTASSMILQGRADEFTAKPPGQRKQVLGQILGLDVYDRLLERTRVKERAAATDLEKAKARLAEIQERLSAKPGLEADMARLESDLEAVAGEIEAKEQELKEVQDLVGRLELGVQKSQEIEAQVEALVTEIASAQRELLKRREQADLARKVLDAEDRILKHAEEYDAARARVAALEAEASRLAAVRRERSSLEAERAQAERDLAAIAGRIADIRRLLSDREALEEAAGRYREALRALEDHEKITERWRELDQSAREAQEKAAARDHEIETEIARLETALEDARAQAAILDDVPCKGGQQAGACPLLGRARKAAVDVAAMEGRIEELNRAANPYIEPWQEILRERDALGYDPAEHRRRRDLVAELRPKAEKAGELAGKAELLSILEASESALTENIRRLGERLDTVTADVAALEASARDLEAVRASLPNLERWARAKEELPAARQAVAAAAERIGALEQEIGAKEQRVSTLKEEQRVILEEASSLKHHRMWALEVKEALTGLQERRNNLHGAAGGLRARLDTLARDEEEQARLLREIEPRVKDLVRWQTLVKAFGRDGIPALIIENAVPELERIANEILSEMSKGEHTLRFETQRDLKSREGMAETLDIIVGDWAGDRLYETFSGGEQLRIDLAIRFALAELLAHRAGSRVEWLTVDEGLGSQDAEHRALVLESIKAVADRFRKTFIITHIEEAKSHIDQVIYIEPGERATEIRVA